MPRGRHRHSPPLHRLLPPSVIAGVSVVCAVGPWLFTEPLVLRGLAAGAAVTTIVGSVVMRRWDVAAGKRVADLTRARAHDEWRHEERVAELETDLDESRELRAKLEQKLRAKRTELANLRNEHAALLRRYATAETERASALEGRRLLAIEATVPARELPAPDTRASGADGETAEDAASPVEAGPEGDVESVPPAPGVFSREGSALFLAADEALARLAMGATKGAKKADAGSAAEDGGSAAEDGGSAEDGESLDDTSSADDSLVADDSPVAEEAAPAASAEAENTRSAEERDAGAQDAEAQDDVAEASAKDSAAKDPATKDSPTKGGPGNGGGQRASAEPDAPESDAVTGAAEPAPAVEPEHAPAHQPQAPAAKPTHSTGHFTVPTAVAVVPSAPRPRPAVEGGFDFFGTQKSQQALESVQNEDLADVVGQEALAMHKAETESGFKAADPEARAVGQVIDLTAHDETEPIDVKGLRTAAS